MPYIRQTMYRIQQAARLTGVSEASLRAWERRYGVVVPARTAAGYRVYDEESLAVVTRMRQLVEAGWAPGQAAEAVRSRRRGDPGELASPTSTGTADDQGDGVDLMRRFLRSAAEMDLAGFEQSLDGGFGLGSFERVVDSWLCPALVALGEGWARGEIDVAGEHAASHAVHRRLSAAYEAAGTQSHGPEVVVGLPPGSRHELGALAFATALRRIGHRVLYLGADVPTASWLAAVEQHQARAAVLAVATSQDRGPAADVADHLRADRPDLVVATGGAAGENVAEAALSLPDAIGSGAHALDDTLVGEPAGRGR